jgi:hypothetical protein
VEYPSIELTLLGWCANEDDALAGPLCLVDTTKWNLFHPNLVDWSEHGTWCQSLSLGRRHEK